MRLTTSGVAKPPLPLPMLLPLPTLPPLVPLLPTPPPIPLPDGGDDCVDEDVEVGGEGEDGE